MIHHMDEGIGRLLALLAQHGLTRDTLLVVTSDNGGERFSDNWPLVGGKMDLTEGGIRVPWIAHWAAVAPDADYPLDGKSLMPLLREATTWHGPALFWRMNHRGQRAMRQGAWK